ncbi:MAG: hypothetical protein M1816_005671 [Peltula sp. TS41687]|nr:MAG: hypothetical protein M1816_005671 [Peltula sp. TS41687]
MHVGFRIPFSQLSLFLLALSLARAFYIPGWSIKSYKDGDSIPLFVNKVYSDSTQLQYAYYDLPFICPPSGQKHADANLVGGHSISLNLGEVLRGDRIRNSDYDLHMGKDQACRFLCNQEVDRRGVKRGKELMAEGYMAEWIVDNLPGATRYVTVDKTRRYYAAGFKMGEKDYSPTTGRARYFIHNHVTLVLRWRKAPGKEGEAGRKVIVGFEVYPKSIGDENRNPDGCPKHPHESSEGLQLYIPTNDTDIASRYAFSSYTPQEADGDLDDGAKLSIPYTYSVYFQEDKQIEWTNRWDPYFVNQEDSFKIHWLSLLNSSLGCIALTVPMILIFTRNIPRDLKSHGRGGPGEGKIRLRKKKKPSSGGQSLSRTEQASGGFLDQQEDLDHDADVSSDDDALEEMTGWKLLHGDVFRPPPYGELLAPLIGSGMQLVFMAGGLVILSCLGILNPSFRGGFISVGVGLFVFAGVFSGYFSGRVYHTFGGQNWRNNALMTALLFPGLLFTLIVILNLFVWAQASSTAIPFGTLVALAALWLFIQLPLVYVGSWFGYVRIGAWEHPTKTHVLPRQIPQQSWFYTAFRGVLSGGFPPFAFIFIELIFVFKSIWQDKSGYYYVFGFLAVVSIILVLTVIDITVITLYFQLCAENHHWWWRSFFVGGSSAIWIFFFTIWYFYTNLHIQGFISTLLFFSYSFLACAVYGLLTGTIGFLTAYAFVRHMYGAIKAD